jgi:hypothetical protein
MILICLSEASLLRTADCNETGLRNRILFASLAHDITQRLENIL